MIQDKIIHTQKNGGKTTNKMNFKPTLWKSIVSVVVGVITWFLLYGTITCKMGVECNYLNLSNMFFPFLSLVLIYVIWSLIQRK